MDDIPAALLADAHRSPCSLPLIVQCCGTPQNADNDYLSLAKFMRLGPLKSDSSCDSDDKTQPNNQSESNRNNNHKAQCKSQPKTNKRLTRIR